MAEPAPVRRGIGGKLLVGTAAAFALLIGGGIAWLQLSGPPHGAGTGPAATVKLPAAAATSHAGESGAAISHSAPSVEPGPTPHAPEGHGAAPPPAPDAHAPSHEAALPPAAGAAHGAGDSHADPHAPAPPAVEAHGDHAAPSEPDSHGAHAASDNHGAGAPADNHGAGGAAPDTHGSGDSAAVPPARVVLAPVPDPFLVEQSADGPLPMIGPNRRESWQVYARPFERGGKPRIGIVIAGLGLVGKATQQAIADLPPSVSLSFLPYASDVQGWIEQARNAGHEVLLDLPMEPLDYPRLDPGPHALLSMLDTKQNIGRLAWIMSRGTGYIGLTTYMGSRFVTIPDQIRPVLGELKRRGLGFVDARSTADGAASKAAADIKLARVTADRIIDSDLSGPEITRVLGELEAQAKRTGVATGVGGFYPVTQQAVIAWAKDLPARGIVLAPVSSALVP